MFLPRLWGLSCCLVGALALPAVGPPASVRPLVLWHGLGDSHSSPGMLEFQSLLKEAVPYLFVHSIYVDPDQEQDRRAGFYGNVDEQIDLVAAQLRDIPQLKHGLNFDAVGFSQGGQFLRAYVERFNDPPINNLITFGSQHMGISDIPTCKRYDLVCQLARRAAKAAAYGDWAQQNIVQAQYYRDPAAYGTYLDKNHFLASINNEVPYHRNETYASNLASLSNLVLVLFTEDKTVVPKESAWFGSEAVPAPEFSSHSEQSRMSISPKDMVPMRMQPLYTEDWIGLKQLDEKGGVSLKACTGEHMQLNGCWREIILPFIGGPV